MTLVRRGALIVVSLALAFALANALVASFLPFDGVLFQLDEELHFTTRPGARRITVMDPRVGGDWVPVRINGDGYRGAPLAESSARLVVVGDSLVLAENVRLEETFVHRLGVHLAERGAPYDEVVNAGLSGYGPDQITLKLERELDALAPAAVVLVLCATNDFGDLVRNKLFELADDGSLLRFPSVIDPLVPRRFEQSEETARRPALARLWETATRARAPVAELPAARYIEECLQASRAHYIEFVVRREPSVYSLFEDTYDADIAIFPDWSSSRAKVRLMAAVLARMAHLCGERGVPLAGVVVPAATDVAPGFSVRVDPERWPSYDPDRLASTLARLLEEAGVAALDLTDDFRAAQGGPDALFVGAGDFHWNARGQELGADRTAEFLVERGF